MITAAEFNSKLTELNTEYCKIIDAGNTAEAFRWLIETVEFLETLIEEAGVLDNLTEEEKNELFCEAKSAGNIRYWMSRILLRYRKEDKP